MDINVLLICIMPRSDIIGHYIKKNRAEILSLILRIGASLITRSLNIFMFFRLKEDIVA